MKQKQANVSEALSARKQAEITTQQAEKAAEYAEKGVDEATLARTQAEETARQGRTVLLFTVITIIFVRAFKPQAERELTVETASSCIRGIILRYQHRSFSSKC